MKIKEVELQRELNEDWADWVPGGKTAQKIGSGIKGAMSPISDFKTGYQQRASDQQLTALAQQMYPAWNQAIVNLRQQQIPEPQIAKHMKKWVAKNFEIPVARVPEFPEPNITPNASMNYLKTAWAIRQTPTDDDEPPVQTTATTGNIAPQSSNVTPQTSNVSPQSSNVTPQTSNVSPQSSNVAPQTSNVAPQTSNVSPQSSNVAPTTSTVTNPVHEMFTDPAKFTAEFNEYLKTLPRGASIALRQAIKTMWMKTGGLRAESVIGKGQRI